GWLKESGAAYWPVKASRVLYQDGFRTEDGKAQLQNAAKDSDSVLKPVAKGRTNTNHITTCFEAYLQESTS
ncbi:hypothetical protein ADUPG1_004780, partial [Aduncisulcus paluster]